MITFKKSIHNLKIFIIIEKKFLLCYYVDKKIEIHKKGAIAMITSTTQIIEQALIEANMSKTQLATALGMSPQSLYQRFKTGKFSYNELQRIAVALGSRLQLAFVFEENRL